MNPVETQVRTVRARLRRAAGFGAAVRWALYGALIAGGWLVAGKLFGWARGPFWMAALLPVGAGALAAARRLDLRYAAALVDRALGLEERVATAFEGPRGPFAVALSSDAERLMDPHRVASVGRFRWPGEARFLVPALALVGVLVALPEPARSVRLADPELRASVDPEIDRLTRVPVKDATLAARVKSILEDLKSEDLQRMASGAESARTLAAEIRAGLSKAGGDRDALRSLADRLEAAGSGAASNLARRGVDVPEVAPLDLESRIADARARGDIPSSGSRPEGWDVGPASSDGPGVSLETRREVDRWLAANSPDPRYDSIVRRYYERRAPSLRR